MHYGGSVKSDITSSNVTQVKKISEIQTFVTRNVNNKKKIQRSHKKNSPKEDILTR